MKQELAESKANENELDKYKTKLRKAQNKALGAELKQAVGSAWQSAGLTGFGGALFGNKIAKNKLKELHPEWSEDDIRKGARALQGQAALDALANFAKQLENQINDIAGAQGAIDTRLQGSKGRTWLGSRWKAMSQDVVMNVGMSPLVKQADVVTNLKNLVGQGIAFDVEQRAFLQTISDRIATTFSATDATLLKLVRIQQQDTTAARLGMESALTAFLNNMYETTEYMQSAAADIRSQLYEASALMGAASATGFEFQVQKWLGSLYSVGFSNASGIAGALGKLAAGDISGITGGGMGNLMVMAANRANMSVADILADGLDESETNQLMQAMVNYLAEIYGETKGSNVLAQQFASVYGVTASDLKAAANLAKSTSTIAKNNLDYNGMMGRLTSMANSMYARTSTGGMMQNMFDNLKYSTANSMANNPALYAIYSIASMLDSTVGGIAIPSIMAMGTGFDLETTVADLMRVASLGTGLLGGVGTMIAGLAKGSGGGFSGSGMLKAFGINGGLNSVSRGSGMGFTAAGVSSGVSESGYIGNANGGDVQSKTMTDATDDANNQVQAKKDENDDLKLKDVNESIVSIYNLLNEVTMGTKKLHVDIDDTFSWTTAVDGSGFGRF